MVFLITSIKTQWNVPNFVPQLDLNMTFHHNNYNARVRLYTEFSKSKNFLKNFKTFEIP